MRRAVQPLNRPAPGTDPELTAAARVASTDAYRLAMLVGAALLVAGAATNYVGLRPGRERPEPTGRGAPVTGSSG